MIEIYAIGGHSEVGKNCTAINVDGEVVVLDLGLHLDNFITHFQDTDIVEASAKKLIELKAAPDINIIKHLFPQIKAICITHGHLDHVGAAPYLANKLKAPIHGSEFTIEILRKLAQDRKIKLRNPLLSHNVNSRFRVSENIEIEFINITHSIIQTVLIAVHTKYGVIIYANDYKLDDFPTLGQKTNYKRLKQLDGKVIALIGECLYAHKLGKTPSEKVAREKLREVLVSEDFSKNNIVISTFSSHIARLKSIVEFSEKIGRKVVMLGRSLHRYTSAAQDLGLADFMKKVKLVRYTAEAKKFLKNLKNPHKYVFVVTGHQGEPKAMLSKMSTGEIKFPWKPEDVVIFSCNVIPVLNNIENRESLEAKLKQKKIRIFTGVHESGHASREDIREFLKMFNPKIIIPTHGAGIMTKAMRELAEEMGYKDENIKLLKVGDRVSL